MINAVRPGRLMRIASPVLFLAFCRWLAAAGGLADPAAAAGWLPVG